MALLELGLGVKVWSGLGTVRSVGRRLGLSAYKLVRVVGRFEALTAQVVVPNLRESLVLGVEIGKLHVLTAHDVPAPLLYAYEIVSVVVGIEFAVRSSKHISGSRMRSPFCSP